MDRLGMTNAWKDLFRHSVTKYGLIGVLSHDEKATINCRWNRPDWISHKGRSAESEAGSVEILSREPGPGIMVLGSCKENDFTDGSQIF